MHRYALLALVPVAVLCCDSPDTHPCASYVSASGSAFCATFTESAVTTGLPTWATSYCSASASSISKECTCWYSGTAVAATTTTRATTTTAAVTTTKATTATTSTGGSVSATNTCGSAPIDQLVGYGEGTTGGGSGSGTTVTTCDEFSAAAANGGVIKVSGILAGCGQIKLVSDTTILGVGSQSGFTGTNLWLNKITNVIIRNLYMHDAPESDDLIRLTYSTYVWVDHCDLSSDGLVGDKDYYDGALDITHASDFVTVSWTKFHDHWKVSLIGHSDSNGAEDTGHLRVTYHHNYFYNCNSRLPSIRFGTGHIYSSCYEENPTSGINSRMGAQVLVENSYFLDTADAIITDLDSDTDGYAVQQNNIFVNSPIEITQVGSLTPPYSYTQDPADCVCDLVTSKAGTGVIG